MVKRPADAGAAKSVAMRNDMKGPDEDERLSGRLTLVALVAAVLIMPPLLSTASLGGQVFGLPVVWVYLFVAWAVVIALVASLVRRSE